MKRGRVQGVVVGAVLAVACSGATMARGQEAPAAGAALHEGHRLRLVTPGKVLVSERFTMSELPNRRLTRGNWKVEGGIAAVAHDDELYRQYKNHGPALWYDQSYRDGIVHFEFRPSKQCQRFVFTVNGADGHVFRFMMQESGTDIRAWDKDHKGRQLVSDGPGLARDEWIPVTVEFAGPKAAVHIGNDYHVVVEDPTYAVEKTVTGVSFHYGDVKLRKFTIAAAQPK